MESHPKFLYTNEAPCLVEYIYKVWKQSAEKPKRKLALTAKSQFFAKFLTPNDPQMGSHPKFLYTNEALCLVEYIYQVWQQSVKKPKRKLASTTKSQFFLSF